LPAALSGLGVTLGLAIATWIASLVKKDASIVDSVWSVLILAAGFTYATAFSVNAARPLWVLVLVALWCVRLSAYITWRNWRQPEDRRYQQIRARNQPAFEWKSLYLVFLLQGVLAWIVSLPVLAAIAWPGSFAALDWVGIAVVAFGIAFESVGDFQLSRFKSRPQSRGQVMDRGLWRYTRHPNYFGEFCVWWGFFLLALAAGGWWAVVSPLLMSFLLLKVSGVTLLEQDIGERRPAYRDYVARTNAFFPGAPRSATSNPTES
jgi:steroid 5-alpha reductase family enzyme